MRVKQMAAVEETDLFVFKRIQTTLNVGDELEVFFLDKMWMIPIATVAVSTQNVWYEPEGFLMTGPNGWHVEHMLVQQRVELLICNGIRNTALRGGKVEDVFVMTLHLKRAPPCGEGTKEGFLIAVWESGHVELLVCNGIGVSALKGRKVKDFRKG